MSHSEQLSEEWVVTIMKRQPSGTRGRGRPRKQNSPTIRVFKMPKFLLEAKSYNESIDWSNSQVTEPPFLKDLMDEQIKDFIEKPLKMHIPSNTQFVERMIKVITQKGTAAADPKIRKGFARATIKSQMEIPKCETKKDFAKFCSI